ncbi:MAG: hypothetical protein PHX77_06785, partial [Candidatus Bipolaricaulis sp.]|nr:hypothetical protein [Candidatus Bipolaricaulis sp.]
MSSKMSEGRWRADRPDRAPTLADVDRVVEMLNARSRKLHGTSQSTRARVVSWWEKPGFALETDARLVLDWDGAVAGLAFILADGEPYTHIGCSAAVHPRYEDDALLWDRVTNWSLHRATELVPRAAPGLRVAATSDASSDDGAHCAALERAGFAPVRVESPMRIDLGSPVPITPWPDGISVRTANLGADVDDIVS